MWEKLHHQNRLRILSCGRHREPEVPEESPSGRMSRWPCKDYIRGICNNSFCEKWQPLECLFYKTKSGCRFGEKCSYAHRQVDEQPSKRSKKNDDKSAVAMLKKNDWHENVREPVVNHAKGHDRSGRPDKKRDHELKRGPTGRRSSNARQMGCVFQDMKLPKSILRKSFDMQRPIQRVKFSKAIAREAAWKLAKSVFKLKDHRRATFFSPSERRCLLASTLKPEEREFVVDSGASMHMISKKDLSKAEMDTLTKSCSPTTVITANGEVQTHEEAIVYVKELDIFLTMKVLDNTPAVLSLGKLCDENGYSCEWINGQKPQLIKNGIRIPCNTENFVPIVVPGLSSSSSGSSSTSKTPSRQESHTASSSSTSSSSPTVSETQTRERGDQVESDFSPLQESNTVEYRSGRPDDTQANKTPKTNLKGIQQGTE